MICHNHIAVNRYVGICYFCLQNGVFQTRTDRGKFYLRRDEGIPPYSVRRRPMNAGKNMGAPTGTYGDKIGPLCTVIIPL